MIPAIVLNNLGKCYHIYDTPRDRLLQMLFRGRRQYFREFWALHEVNLQIMPGEVVGIVGSNGAGKSTLLQLVCGTLAPTTGDISVKGRVAALLELGAGFNPEFSGRENVYMSAAVTGLSQQEVNARFEEIVDFSGLRDFIDQPVKTYSSGMYMRLAFSVATSVDPNILVIDEALSVGDGGFARKSFDRIMQLKERGATILFCSHSLYQVEAFCERALWLEKGNVRLVDKAAHVTAAYQASMDKERSGVVSDSAPPLLQQMSGRILKVYGGVDGLVGTTLRAISLKSTVTVTVEFALAPNLPPPGVAVGITNAAGMAIASASSVEDDVRIDVDSAGRGAATVIFENIPLLKGEYSIMVFVTCEKAMHVYDMAERCITLQITQDGLAQGVVALPHQWRSGSA